MKIAEVEIIRESLTLPINDNKETWDYLTIYDIDHNILARSGNNHPQGIIQLDYEGFEFVSYPGATDHVYITLKSIKKVLENEKV